MLNIARNIYTGWDAATRKYELPEAEIIPCGESTTEKRKLETITKNYPTLKEYENIPLPGFTLFKSDRKKWGSIDQTWLVIDPRGFLVRILNENLENILHVTGITEGLIQEKCVWARDDSKTKMILVPVSSPKYIEAVKNTELIEGKVDLKDVQIGDTVLLQNELQGTYMGILSLYGPINNYNIREEYKSQVYLRRQVIEVKPGKYHYQTDLKILKVIKKAELPFTREESAIKMNNDIKKGAAFFTPGTNMSTGYFSVHGMIKHVSIHAVPKVTITFEEIPNLEATALFYDAQALSDFGMLALRNSTNNYLIDFPYSFSAIVHPITAFNISEMQNNLDPAEKIMLKEPRKSIFGHSGRTPVCTKGIADFKKFYKIVKHIKTETYI